MKFKQLARVVVVTCVAVALGIGSFTPGALAGSTVSISSDTFVFLSGSGITLTLAAGGSLVSYSVSAATLTLNLDSGSNVTVRSGSLYTLTNSQSQTTLCSGASYSYVNFTASSPAAVTVTPSATSACAGGVPPEISVFSASPTSITAGRSATLSWSVAGAITASIDGGVGSLASLPSGSATVTPGSTTTYTLTATNGAGTSTAQAMVTVAAPCAIGGFSASPLGITSGNSSTLSWTTSNCTSAAINSGVGSVTPVASGSAAVSPTSTTTYTLTATDGTNSPTATATVTVSAPSAEGGGGGPLITPPAVSSFTASPAGVTAGQSSTLSWSVTGASRVSIAPDPGAGTLNPLSGTAHVTPASTTTYTLFAYNVYGQTTAAATVTVTVGTANPAPSASNAPQPQPGQTASGTPETSPPSAPSQASPTPAASEPAYCLVNNSGTFSLILNGIRHGVSSPGLLSSYGYGFQDAVPDAAAYQALPSGDLLGPGDGALVKIPSSPTVYLVSGGTRHGFTSIAVFRSLGFKTASVLTVPAAQLDALPDGTAISDKTAGHLPGVNVSSKGTVYLLGDTARLPYPSLAVFNTWNLRGDFSRVVPANAADLALPLGPPVTPRPSCTSQ